MTREAMKRTLGMRHFDVQLMGAAVLHQGKIAEMRTGEGKTLVAPLAAILNALSGRGVHVVTVNDYLARRDPQWMGPVFHFLGVSVGMITHDASFVFEPGYPTNDERLLNLRPVTRREAYAADITYGTNNEFGFDYLRDNMVLELDQRVQRERSFAIVDEVDNILIDEARTPLIISGQAEESADLYFTFARLVPRLKGTARGRRGGRRLLHRPQGQGRLLDRGGHREDGGLARRREHVRRRPAPRPPLRAGAARPRALQARPRLHRQGRRDHHRRRVHRPPDAGPALERGPPPGDRGQGGPARPARERDPRHDHLPELLPAVRQAVGDDRHGDDRGRGAPQDLQARGRRHPDPPRDGPRGLRRTSSSATSRPSSTRSSTRSSRCRRRAGRSSSARSRSRSPRCSPTMLKRRGIKHEVLNAKFHEKESGIVAQAGRTGAVTIATNMAGRGTDILLGGNPAGLASESLHKRGLNPAEVDAETYGRGPRRGQGDHRGGPRPGRRRRRPAHHRHRAPRLAAHRQPAPRPRRPPGRPGLVALLPVARRRPDEALRQRPGDRADGAARARRRRRHRVAPRVARRSRSPRAASRASTSTSASASSSTTTSSTSSARRSTPSATRSSTTRT